MTKGQKDLLFQIIKSLSKSEKRQFKLYVGRLGINAHAKFLNLFNLLDKSKVYNEMAILETGIVKKQQLANLKSHLYKQILISLKLNPSQKNIRSQLREELDFATILYHKGFYKQSLKILEKAKQLALQYEEKNIAYDVVEFEKIIETQYITRSIVGRADELTLQAEILSKQNVLASKLSNLSLQLYSMFLKIGYIKSAKEAEQVTKYFNKKLPKYDIRTLGFREKLWLYKAFLWYSFLLHDFKNSYKYASKWVELYTTYPNMINLNPVFYLKGNNYLLEALFYTRQGKKFEIVLNKLISKSNSNSFPSNTNVSALSFLYINIHRLNKNFISGTFDQGLLVISDIEQQLKHLKYQIDSHHIRVFYYKFACMYFGAGYNESCIHYLSKIIADLSTNIREDLLCFSHILNVIAHYEAGLDYHLEALLKATYKFLIKMNDLYEVQKALILFIRELQDIYPHELKQAFINLYNKLKTFEDDIFERRAFLYLDILSWLESKIENKTVAEVVRVKYLE